MGSIPVNVLREPILIIDPGHGGRDPGGGSNQYFLEKDLVLKISLYQYRRFIELKVPVTMTRETDITLDSRPRTSKVKKSGAKYCISNHINAGGGDGAETIHSIHSDGSLARTLVNEIQKEGQNIRRVFTRTYPGNNGLDYYYMHRETGAVKTIITEYGFADSKRDDVDQLRQDWEKYAEAVIRGFCKHIGHPYTPPGANSRVFKDVPPGHWAEDILEQAKALGITRGHQDGTFGIGEPLTREQGVAMIMRLYDVLKEE